MARQLAFSAFAFLSGGGCPRDCCPQHKDIVARRPEISTLRVNDDVQIPLSRQLFLAQAARPQQLDRAGGVLLLELGIVLVGPKRMLYFSDHRWVDSKLVIDNVGSLKLPAAQEAMIFHSNALRLFNR